MLATQRCTEDRPLPQRSRAAMALRVAVPLLSAEEGLHREARLLDRVRTTAISGGVVFWRSQKALSVPRVVESRQHFGAIRAAMAKAGWPVVVRATGGDVLPLTPGLLNIGLCFAHPGSSAFGIAEAYKLLCEPLIEVLGAWGIAAVCGRTPGALCDGEYNLVVEGRKLAGTAQRWRHAADGSGRMAILAEATIFGDDDLRVQVAAAEKFYRLSGMVAGLKVDRHVTLAELLPGPYAELGGSGLLEAMAAEIAQAFRRRFGWPACVPSD